MCLLGLNNETGHYLASSGFGLKQPPDVFVLGLSLASGEIRLPDICMSQSETFRYEYLGLTYWIIKKFIRFCLTHEHKYKIHRIRI